MRKLRRSHCAVLPLVLKGRWYDMIASGEKRVIVCREVGPWKEARDAKAKA